jgi:hypothetical protein
MESDLKICMSYSLKYIEIIKFSPHHPKFLLKSDSNQKISAHVQYIKSMVFWAVTLCSLERALYIEGTSPPSSQLKRKPSKKPKRGSG